MTGKTAVFKADCNLCRNRRLKSDGSSMCVVKCIDCSVRPGMKPCSHFNEIEEEKKERRFKVHMTACAVQTVDAFSQKDASKKADWCDADLIDWEVSEVEEI